MTTYKVTEIQRDALKRMYNEGGIDDTDTLVHKKTINALYKKGLITFFNYANCTMWQLTDNGLKELGVLH